MLPLGVVVAASVPMFPNCIAGDHAAFQSLLLLLF
jgi:hypothetical protein